MVFPVTIQHDAPEMIEFFGVNVASGVEIRRQKRAEQERKTIEAQYRKQIEGLEALRPSTPESYESDADSSTRASSSRNVYCEVTTLSQRICNGC
jgi:hypothetical protein